MGLSFGISRFSRFGAVSKVLVQESSVESGQPDSPLRSPACLNRRHTSAESSSLHLEGLLSKSQLEAYNFASNGFCPFPRPTTTTNGMPFMRTIWLLSGQFAALFSISENENGVLVLAI